MSICKHANSTAEFPFPYPPVGKNSWFNVPKFSSLMAATIKVTSTLQPMKQWKLYFSFLMVFTGWKCVSSLPTQFRMGGGGSAKRFPATFPQHFRLFVFNHFSTQLQNFRAIRSTGIKLFNLNQDHLSKKSFFLVKPV